MQLQLWRSIYKVYLNLQKRNLQKIINKHNSLKYILQFIPTIQFYNSLIVKFSTSSSQFLSPFPIKYFQQAFVVTTPFSPLLLIWTTSLSYNYQILLHKKSPEYWISTRDFKNGGYLLSHLSAVPSTWSGLTSLFGMGRGGTLTL